MFIMDNLGCQFDKPKEKPKLRSCLHQTGMSSVYESKHVLDCYLMEKGPAHRGWCHPQEGGHGLWNEAD